VALGANSEGESNDSQDKVTSRKCEDAMGHVQECARDLQSQSSSLTLETQGSENDNDGADRGVGGFHAGTHGALAAVTAGQASFQQKYDLCLQLAEMAINRCQADAGAEKNTENPALRNIANLQQSMATNLQHTNGVIRAFQENLRKVKAAAKSNDTAESLGSLGVP